MWKDLIYVIRMLRKHPAFTAVAVVSLALGIGANTAIFSFVNAVLLKRLNVPDPSRLVTFAESYNGETARKAWNLNTVDELAKRSPVFKGVFGRFPKLIAFSKDGDTAQWILSEMVTGQYFETLQIKSAAGKLFDDADVRDAAATPVCVISYGLWQREFAGDRAAVGRKIFLNGHSYRVIGITAQGFFGVDLQHAFDVQIPATRIADFMPTLGGTHVEGNTLSWLSSMARLKPGVSIIEAREATQRLLQESQRPSKQGLDPGSRIHLLLEDGSRGFSTVRSSFGRPVLVLMSVAAIVLLVACANLANLLLARAQTRSKEFAVRLSLGASRARLLRQLLLENACLGAIGGVGGLFLSVWISRTLLAFLNVGKSTASAITVTPDARVLWFSVLLSFVTAILFGVIPAWQATRTEILPALKHNSGGSARRHHLLQRRSLVVIQIVLSTVTVFAAGLLTRTLRGLQTMDLGFEPDRILALNVDPVANGYSSADASRILDEILRRTRLLPGAKAASLASGTPAGSVALSMNIDVPGYTPKRPEENIVEFDFVSPSYFHTMGQSLIHGRDFSERDNKTSERVAIVNEKFALHFFPGQIPVGAKFHQGGGEVQIAGVVGNVRNQDVRKSPREVVYVPEKQGQALGLTLLVRTGNSPDRLIPSLLALVRSVDKRLPVTSAHTLNVQIEAGLSSERILGYLSSLFGILTTLLVGIGLYGVISYSVASRTREIGVRIAIGAPGSSIVLLFARETLVMLAIGFGIGAPLAIAAGNVFSSLLFGLTAADPLTLLGSAFILVIAALLAVIVPLRRAATVSPLAALHHE